jgi:hypothetical protein
MANYVIPLSTNFDEHAIIRAADNGVPIYSQYDSRWANHPYDTQPGKLCKPPTPTVCLCNDNSTIATSGCGVMAMTMAINFWAKKTKMQCNQT